MVWEGEAERLSPIPIGRDKVNSVSQLLRYICLITLTVASLAVHSAVDCRNALTQRDMDHCNGLESARLDQRLNRAYRQLMSELPPDSRKQLRDKQRAWAKDRDSECRRVWKNGAWDKPVWEQISCVSSMTEQRIKVLQEWKSR